MNIDHNDFTTIVLTKFIKESNDKVMITTNVVNHAKLKNISYLFFSPEKPDGTVSIPITAFHRPPITKHLSFK